MKAHIASALSTFQSGCDHADGLRHIHSYLVQVAPPAMDCGDILRAAVVLLVSSFDLYVHDIFRLEVLERLKSQREVFSLRIPFKSALLSGVEQIIAIEECIRKDHAYKSFVAPDKLSECLRSLIENPWENIAEKFGVDVSVCKSKLKQVVDLRNRIAHEADVNPLYGGVDLWPIYSQDVENSLVFMRSLGKAVAHVIDSG